MMRKVLQEEDFIEEPVDEAASTAQQYVDQTVPEYLSGERDEVQEVKQIAKSETLRIRVWRYIVGFTILGAGALVSLGTYFYLDRQLKDETEDKFYVFANTIEDVSRMHFQSMVDSIHDLSLTITAQAERNNWTFPFVTVDNWEVHAQKARQRGFLEVIQYLPWIEGQSELDAFSVYVAENFGWQESAIETFKWFHPELKSLDFPVNKNPFVIQTGSLQVDGNVQEKQYTIAKGDGPFVPLYQRSPPLQLETTMIDIYSYDNGVFPSVAAEKVLLMGSMDVALGKGTDVVVSSDMHKAMHSRMHAPHSSAESTTDPSIQAHTIVYEPVFTELGDDTSKVGGFLTALFGFDFLLVELLPESIRGFYLVVENSCGDSYTYMLDGNHTYFVGKGDLSDTGYHYLKREIVFDHFYSDPERVKALPNYCVYKYTITSSSLYEDDNESSLPIMYTFVVATIFVLMALAFFIYDMYVEKRNDKMVDTAAKSNALVSSIFPSTVRDRLLAESTDKERPTQNMSLQLTKTHLKSFLSGDSGYRDDEDDVILKSRPIADLFTETTIMFGDISGFTAWSSVREPSQVFTLLETVYRAFDQAASRRGVFKVETVGDCYVAVCGLPDPRSDHAVVMARFARDCLQRMTDLSRKLEVLLGPDTGDLGMRIGLHSGPVTAGVLRGERSRFQLFGDTMNTASRMESTGEVNRIQVSEETAKLLIAAGKQHWVCARERGVAAKGKGILSTYWLTSNQSENAPAESAPESAPENSPLPQIPKPENQLNAKTTRLIGWNVEVLLGLLKRIVKKWTSGAPRDTPNTDQLEYEAKYKIEMSTGHATILDEVEEVIRLPLDQSEADHSMSEHSATHVQEDAPVEIGEVTLAELTQFVSCIASMYNENPFHNFEHASHVTMSVVKLLSRIVAPSEVDYEKSATGSKTLHDHTYGITSDPLTQFACVLSALIHDVDHPGVPNAQLVKEDSALAATYKGKSVAEQNSVQLSWQLLMSDQFANLRRSIYSSESELQRFRQLIVNSVMATDIVDKELKALRNARWEKAFNGDNSALPESERKHENVNRKATIVIEHLIQASDVAHTMQHWHIYRKWNERFFMECYQAFKAGRAGEDPSKNWYKGEIGFFDYYIIPLAKKLKECGVFGVSSDEYLNYAMKNRKEWEERGLEIVAELLEKVKAAEVSDNGGEGGKSAEPINNDLQSTRT
ncbi:hypothetical protein ACA910_016490 [Epithemia clementina (nom. ined.)]